MRLFKATHTKDKADKKENNREYFDDGFHRAKIENENEKNKLIHFNPIIMEDLEKEIQERIYNHFFDLDGIAIKGTSAYATVEDMVYIARQFYELGINTRKPRTAIAVNCPVIGEKM